MDLRHRRVLRTVRLGHRDGGTRERAPGSGFDALSEIPEVLRGGTGPVTLTLKLAAVGLFLFVATIMWLPPALHAAVTAAIVLVVLIVPVVWSRLTNRVR
jgi:hypothetical protein